MALLGIEGLPSTANQMAAAGLYGLSIDAASLRVPLLAGAAQASIAAGARVVIASSIDTTTYLKRARLAHRDLSSSARLGQLHLIRQRADTEQSAVTNARRLLSELRHFKLPKASLLLVDLADEWVGANDLIELQKVMSALDDWAELGGHIVLLAFSLSGLGPKALSNLKAVSDGFAGFAVVKQVEDEFVLGVRHWFGQKGPTARSNFALTVTESGTVIARVAASAGRLSLDPAQEHFLATKRAGEAFATRSGQWQLLDSNFEAQSAAQKHSAGTVVLHFDKHSELKELALSVAAIRALGRPQLRIAVREGANRLRTGQMVALFRLGVSIIIPQSLSGTAARLMAESLSGSLFTRSVETDVNKAISEARVEVRTGPHAPKEFNKMVQQLLVMAADMDLPCTLVVLNPQTASGSVATLSAIKRALRDAVFMEGEDGIWVFLFGCAPESAQTVMTRLLGPRFENLLVGWRRLSGAREILPALADFHDTSTTQTPAN